MAYKVISGLFKIVNKENEMYYISASKNIKSAWAGLRSELNHENCTYEDLQKDWNTYGVNSFELVIITEVEVGTPKEIIANMKVEYYETHKGDEKCYNIHTNPKNGIITGIDNKCNKKVVCINTGEVFESLTLANGYFGANDTNIGTSCKVKHKTTGKKDGEKLCWVYYDEYITMSEEDVVGRIRYANEYNCNRGRKLTEEQKVKMRKPRTNKENMFRYSDDDIQNKKMFLIDDLKRFYSIYGRMPKSRELIASNGWSTQGTYIKYFGNVANAWVEAGFDVPEGMTKLIGRNNQLTNEEYIDRTKVIVDKYYSNDGSIKLPTYEYIKNNDDKISESGICRRFGNLQNLLDIIGYTKDFEDTMIKKDMCDKYLEIMDVLGHTPNSREIETFSRDGDGKYYAMSSYIHWFGNLYDLQLYLDVKPSLSLGRTMSRDELIGGLYKLYDDLMDIPTQVDICECEYLPSINSVLSITGFSGMGDLQKSLFGYTYNKTKTTSRGTKCLSQYEYTIALVLEKYKYDFLKDVRYNQHGVNTDKKITTDFMIKENNKIYFIEVFGMTGMVGYDEKTKLKIQLCKDAGVPLLALYPDDFYNMNQKKWNTKIQKFIED